MTFRNKPISSKPQRVLIGLVLLRRSGGEAEKCIYSGRKNTPGIYRLP